MNTQFVVQVLWTLHLRALQDRNGIKSYLLFYLLNAINILTSKLKTRLIASNSNIAASARNNIHKSVDLVRSKVSSSHVCNRISAQARSMSRPFLLVSAKKGQEGSSHSCISRCMQKSFRVPPRWLSPFSAGRFFVNLMVLIYWLKKKTEKFRYDFIHHHVSNKLAFKFHDLKKKHIFHKDNLFGKQSRRFT